MHGPPESGSDRDTGEDALQEKPVPKFRDPLTNGGTPPKGLPRLFNEKLVKLLAILYINNLLQWIAENVNLMHLSPTELQAI